LPIGAFQNARDVTVKTPMAKTVFCASRAGEKSIWRARSERSVESARKPADARERLELTVEGIDALSTYLASE